MLRFELERSIMRRRQREDIRSHLQPNGQVEVNCICLKTAAVFRKRRPFDHCASKNCRTCAYSRQLRRLDRRRERRGKGAEIAEQLQ